jgi:hypothetical protein
VVPNDAAVSSSQREHFSWLAKLADFLQPGRLQFTGMVFISVVKNLARRRIDARREFD